MLSVQIAKETFYTALRDRIAANNLARTVVVRQQVRPAVVVAENELPGAAVDGIAPVDTFCLRWTALSVYTQAPLPLIALTCEVRYATDGSSGATGLDRGRSLAAMDAELAAAVAATPQAAPTLAIAEIVGGGAATGTATGTNIFWGDVNFGKALMRGERMERTAEIEVFSYGQ
jgi:hypothetical protein